jgi:hypothetical protein
MAWTQQHPSFGSRKQQKGLHSIQPQEGQNLWLGRQFLQWLLHQNVHESKLRRWYGRILMWWLEQPCFTCWPWVLQGHQLLVFISLLTEEHELHWGFFAVLAIIAPDSIKARSRHWGKGQDAHNNGGNGWLDRAKLKAITQLLFQSLCFRDRFLYGALWNKSAERVVGPQSPTTSTRVATRSGREEGSSCGRGKQLWKREQLWKMEQLCRRPFVKTRNSLHRKAVLASMVGSTQGKFLDAID